MQSLIVHVAQLWNAIARCPLIPARAIVRGDDELGWRDAVYVLFNRAALTVAYLVHSVQYFRSEAGTTVEWSLCAANHWECWGSSLLQCAALFALYDLFYVPWHRLLHVRLVLHSFEPVCAAASDLPLDSQACLYSCQRSTPGFTSITISRWFVSVVHSTESTRTLSSLLSAYICISFPP